MQVENSTVCAAVAMAWKQSIWSNVQKEFSLSQK